MEGLAATSAWRARRASPTTRFKDQGAEAPVVVRLRGEERGCQPTRGRGGTIAAALDVASHTAMRVSHALHFEQTATIHFASGIASRKSAASLAPSRSASHQPPAISSVRQMRAASGVAKAHGRKSERRLGGSSLQLAAGCQTGGESDEESGGVIKRLQRDTEIAVNARNPKGILCSSWMRPSVTSARASRIKRRLFTHPLKPWPACTQGGEERTARGGELGE